MKARCTFCGTKKHLAVIVSIATDEGVMGCEWCWGILRDMATRYGPNIDDYYSERVTGRGTPKERKDAVKEIERMLGHRP